MKILIMPPYFFPEQMASSHLDHDRFTAYSKNTIDVEVITPTPTRGISQEERKKYKDIKQETMYDGHVNIHRFAMFSEGKNPFLRAFRYFLTNIVQYVKSKQFKNVDLIYSGSTPPIQGLLCSRVKKALSKETGKNIPYVYCLQDIFPDSLVNAKMTHEGSLLWKIGRRIENYTYNNADKIIVISDRFKENIRKKGVFEDKIVVIPNWINTEDVYPVDRKDNPLFDRYHIDRNKFYICYSGNIGHSQNLELLIDVAKSVCEEMPSLCFVLFGEGVAKEEFEEAIKANKLSNIIMLPFQPYEDIANVFSFGDVGLIISKPGIGKSSVPSKTWSIMAAGRPVLASFDLDSEVANLIKKLRCGSVAPAGDKESLINEIKCIFKSDRLSMGNRGRQYVLSELNSEKCTNMYVQTFKNAIG